MKSLNRVWVKAAGVLLISTLHTFAGWSLVWSDEFDQPDGSSPNPNKWVFDLGGGGWGNSELETYTSRTNNARIEGGALVIEARQETYTGPDGIQRDYTSARLKTQGKASWTCGRMEARIKIPRGQGMWPAFWTLGDNENSVGWPTCGEIDIMENIGREPTLVHGTIHGPGYSGGGGIGGPGSLPSGAAFADDFHVFAIEWETNRIRWFVDDQLYFTATPASLPAGTTWVFTQPQFILLNLAVGGVWPGYPDGTAVMPQQMVVDYVRVYAQNAIVDVDPVQDWLGYMNVFDSNMAYQFGNAWGVSDLRASFDAVSGALTLSPNTNVYSATDRYWVNADGSGAKIMDASVYVENADLAGTSVTFQGQCWENTLSAGYNSKAFIKDFTPDYSSSTTTNIALVSGQPFSLTLATTLGDHVQYGFETIGPDASPATVATLGHVVVASSPPPSPVVVSQPVSTTNNAGATVVFNVSATGASAYQWWKGTNVLVDGALVSGAKTASLTLSNVLAAASGDYQVVLSSYSASTTSSPATLTVIDPLIVTNPADATVKAGSDAIFSVAALGSGLTYQWKQNGANAVFATAHNASLTVPATIVMNGYGYSVVVSNSVGQSVTSSSATLVVIPSTSDNTAPSLNIVSPKKNSETNVGVIQVYGTASDNVAVSAVQVGVNGGAFVHAAVTNGVRGAVTWGVPVALSAGTNTVAIKVSDGSGNSRSTNIPCFYQVPGIFTLITNNPTMGTVTITPALPAFVGRTYFITAKPIGSGVLSNIVNVASSGTRVFTNVSPLKQMQKIAVVAEPINEVTINFSPNRFISEAGSYYGLFFAPGPTCGSSGLLVIKATPQLTYSGSMYLDGDLIKGIKGSFDLNGQSVVTVLRTNNKPALTLTLQLGFNKTLTGTISNATDDWVATIDADLAVYSQKSPASAYVGKYTMLIPGFDDSAAGPMGYGYSVIHISASGQVAANGFTADNQPFTPVAVPVSANGRWPVYARQYATASGHNGAVIGWVQFTSNAPTATFAGELFWFKTGWTNSYYNAGFTNHVTAFGSTFVAPAHLALTDGLATFSGSDLSAPAIDHLSIVSGLTLKTQNVQPFGKTYTYSAGSGVLKVAKSTNAPAGVSVIRGCYLQNQNFIGGFFLGTTAAGRLTIE